MIFEVLQGPAYQRPWRDIGMTQRLIETLKHEIQHNVIDPAIDHWQDHLNACVKVKANQFEHLLQCVAI